jgi:hypothetical protein
MAVTTVVRTVEMAGANASVLAKHQRQTLISPNQMALRPRDSRLLISKEQQKTSVRA